MKFTQISEADFREFAAKSPYQSFMQTPEIASYRQSLGWTPYYFAVTEDPKSTTHTPKILAASLVLAKPTFLGYQTFFAPGGPLLDLENRELTTFFFTHLAAFAKKHRGYVLQIDPYYELIQRDRDGHPVPGGFNHQTAKEILESLGFKETPSSQPKYLFALDFANDLKKPLPTKNTPNSTKTPKTVQKQNKTVHLEPKIVQPTPDQIFANFKQNTRNLVHRCERQGITVRELTREELPILKTITSGTADRRHFTDQPLSYYEAMYDLFAPRGEVKFLLAELPIAPASNSAHLPQNPAKTVQKPNKTIHPAPNSAPISTTESIPLSVAMFMLTGNEVVYLYSGSDESYMKKYNAQYLIQWHMIEYAAEHGFARYNFYGIRDLPDPNAKDYGIYRFKKGFGGHVIELIGSCSLPLNAPIYHLHSALSHLKNLLHR